MRQDDSIKSLKRLFDEGTSAGKLYALLGLRYVDQATFIELSEDLRNRDDKIETQEGCIIFQATVCDLLKSIEDGTYDMEMQRDI